MKAAFDLSRFRKICGLLASNQEGERAAAALKATAILKAGGKTWADIGPVDTAALGQKYADAALVDLYKKLLDSERARTTDMAEEIGRLKREVARLKGMWPKGRPTVVA